MRISFKLDDLDTVREKIMDEYPDAGSFYIIRPKGGNEFGVRYWRLVVPEYGISVREGEEHIDYDYFEEIVVFYEEDEKRPSFFSEIYSNVSLSTAVSMLAPEGSNLNPDCYIETEEFEKGQRRRSSEPKAGREKDDGEKQYSFF